MVPDRAPRNVMVTIPANHVSPQWEVTAVSSMKFMQVYTRTNVTGYDSCSPQKNAQKKCIGCSLQVKPSMLLNTV